MSSETRNQSKPEKLAKSKKRKHDVVVHQDDSKEKEKSLVVERPAKKTRSEAARNAEKNPEKELETSKPSALFKPKKGRDWTLSLAVPGSIIANHQKPDQKTLLAGRIARAAAVFCVDEVIVFDDDPSNIPGYIGPEYKSRKKTKTEILNSIHEKDVPWQHPDQFLFHVLSYAECPPYLRHDLFQEHTNLRWVGMLPSLDMPHHLKGQEWCRYREGVAVGPAAMAASDTIKSKNKKQKSVQQHSTYVKCGLPHHVKIPMQIPPGVRVTLRFAGAEPPPQWPHLSEEACENLEVEAVNAATPREEEGYYWGYTVHRASSLSDVFQSCELDDGYDVSIGTSERGVPLSAALPASLLPRSHDEHEEDYSQRIPESFKHLLLVFGGVAGLEPAVASDPFYSSKGLTKESAHEAFDAWINLVQGQGSRTIRTEEAIEFGLFGLKGYVDSMYS